MSYSPFQTPTFGSGPDCFFALYSRCFPALYSRRAWVSIKARYFAWLSNFQPPSIFSIRRPSKATVRLMGSGDRNFSRATTVSSTDTLARWANPGMLPQTHPSRSAIASIVIQISRMGSGSCQTVDSVRDENNFVKVWAIAVHGSPQLSTMSTVEQSGHIAEAEALRGFPQQKEIAYGNPRLRSAREWEAA